MIIAWKIPLYPPFAKGDLKFQPLMIESYYNSFESFLQIFYGVGGIKETGRETVLPIAHQTGMIYYISCIMTSANREERK